MLFRSIGAGAALEEAAEDVRGMLEIGVDGAQHLAARHLPASDHSDGETAFVLAAHHAQFGEALAEARGDFPRAVGAIVIHHDDLVAAGQPLVEGEADGGEKIGDILALVQGGHDEREDGLRVAGNNGRNDERACRCNDDRFGLTIPWDYCQWTISLSGRFHCNAVRIGIY